MAVDCFYHFYHLSTRLVEGSLKSTMFFHKAVVVVRNSHFLHRSVSHLDLSTCELTDLERVTYTEEGFLKSIDTDERRRILYECHLDMLQPPKDTGLRLYHMVNSSLPFQVYGVSRYVNVEDGLYYRGLDKDIAEFVFNSADKLSEMRRYLPTMKKMKLMRPGNMHDISVIRSFLQVLLFNDCEDSEFVIDFVKTCDYSLRWWLITQNENIDNLYFLLYHAQELKMDLFENAIFGCPVDTCLFFCNVNYAVPFLEYGKLWYPTNPQIIPKLTWYSCNSRPYCPESIFESDLPLIRKWLLLHLIHVFHRKTDDKFPEKDYLLVLKLVWKSISEAFLTRREVAAAFKKTSQFAGSCSDMFEFYRDRVLDDLEFHEGPRSLEHLSRCVVRKRMAENFALPDGIDSLPVPMSVREYLLLDL